MDSNDDAPQNTEEYTLYDYADPVPSWIEEATSATSNTVRSWLPVDKTVQVATTPVIWFDLNASQSQEIRRQADKPTSIWEYVLLARIRLIHALSEEKDLDWDEMYDQKNIWNRPVPRLVKRQKRK